MRIVSGKSEMKVLIYYTVIKILSLMIKFEIAKNCFTITNVQIAIKICKLFYTD